VVTVNIHNKVNKKHICSAISVIFICSAFLSFEHFSSSQETYGHLILMTLSIMSGFLFFLIICIIEGYFFVASPIIMIGISVPVLMFIWYLKKGNKVALILCTLIWLLEGYMATIGAYF
jgi:hypothetical protein